MPPGVGRGGRTWITAACTAGDVPSQLLVTFSHSSCGGGGNGGGDGDNA